jgi:hypothetical protein
MANLMEADMETNSWIPEGQSVGKSLLLDNDRENDYQLKIF